MKNAIKCAASGALACCLLVLSPPFASALEYRYNADLYDNYFYTPTSSNHALDLDSKDDSGGSTIIVPSDGMDTYADQTAPRTGSPIISVGSYIDPWGSAVEKQIATDETLNGLEGLSFNRLEGMVCLAGALLLPAGCADDNPKMEVPDTDTTAFVQMKQTNSA